MQRRLSWGKEAKKHSFKGAATFLFFVRTASLKLETQVSDLMAMVQDWLRPVHGKAELLQEGDGLLDLFQQSLPIFCHQQDVVQVNYYSQTPES